MPGVPNRELLIHRFVELRDGGEAESTAGRRTRDALVTEFRPELARVCRSWARRWPGSALDVDDLLQEGVIVLLRVLSDHDPERTPFANRLGQQLRWHLRDLYVREERRTTAGEGYVQHARIDGAAFATVSYTVDGSSRLRHRAEARVR